MSLRQQRQMLRRVGITTLGDVVDDTRAVTVALTPFPMMAITRVIAPTSARPGEVIGIQWEFSNLGGAGTMWTMLYDVDTGEEHQPRIEFPIPAGETGISAVINITMPDDRPLRLHIIIGHVESLSKYVVDDSRTLAVPTVAPPPPKLLGAIILFASVSIVGVCLYKGLK